MTELFFSCLHAPYNDRRALDFLRDLQREYNPDAVYNLGDEADLYRMSRYTQDPSMPTLTQELRKVRKTTKELATIFPEQRVCHSNHVRRLGNRAKDAGLTEEVLRPWREIIGAPETWVWQERWKSKYATVVHGEGFNGEAAANRAMQAYGGNVVMGHLHSQAGVKYSKSFGPQKWILQVGCLIDIKHEAFAYDRHSVKQPILGAGVVVDGVPHFIPMR